MVVALATMSDHRSRWLPVLLVIAAHYRGRRRQRSQTEGRREEEEFRASSITRNSEIGVRVTPTKSHRRRSPSSTLMSRHA